MKYICTNKKNCEISIQTVVVVYELIPSLSANVLHVHLTQRPVLLD